MLFKNTKIFHTLLLTIFIGMFLFIIFYASQQNQVYESSAKVNCAKFNNKKTQCKSANCQWNDKTKVCKSKATGANRQSSKKCKNNNDCKRGFKCNTKKNCIKIVGSGVVALSTGNLSTGQPYNGPGKPQLKRIMTVVKAIKGLRWSGICATGGHMANSEHYHCNAVDIFGGEALLDKTFAGLLAAAKKNSLPIHCIIYERASYSRERGWARRSYSGTSTHDSHIHISGWPSVGGNC